MKARRHSVALAVAQHDSDKKSKYLNEREEIDGIKFASKAEGRRYRALRLLERAKVIADLRLQVRFDLVPGVLFAGAARPTQPLRYIADFTYLEAGQLVVEDVKGVQTDAFRIKRHLMKALHGIDIKLTGRGWS
jgi:hypothetical protein